MTTRIQDSALNWFVQLNDADVTEATWVAFTEWLEVDPAHALAYDRVEQTWVAVESAVPDAVNDPLIFTQNPANDAAPLTGRARSARGWLTPAMAVAAATIMVVGLWPEISGQGRFQTFSSEDAPRDIVLSDGTTIALNRQSELRSRIGRKQRDIVLTDGEAAFDVAHDASRPFVIAAGDHEVRVLGTAFNIVNHDDHFTVGVSRGLIAVSGTGLEQPVRLTAGQQVAQTGATTAVVSSVDAQQTTAWRHGVLVYRNADLASVAQDLSRYLDKPVNVSASARALRFTGALRIGDEATMLRQLQDFVPIQVARANDGIQLTARDGA